MVAVRRRTAPAAHDLEALFREHAGAVFRTLYAFTAGRRAIAEEAFRRKSGARGLRAILEELMLDVMYEIPSLDGVKECVVDRSVVESRKRPELVFENKAAS